MSFEEPLTQQHRYVFQPDPNRPGAVFVHTPQQEPPRRFLHDAAASLIFATLAAAMAALVGAILGLVPLFLGFGQMAFLWVVVVCAGAAGCSLLALLSLNDFQTWRRRHWMRHYPGDLVEQASARAFAYWLGTLTSEELGEDPLRGDMRWKVHPDGLTLISMSINDVDEDFPQVTTARAFACVADLALELRERTWVDLGVDADRAAHLAPIGGHLKRLPPAVCMTDILHLSTAHQRLPVLGALIRQGQAQP